MTEISLENFRCFYTKQTARLAPLTILVGDNSTGKTSFLAMIRTLWDCVYGHHTPNFKEDPFDLGTFDEIAYHRGNGNTQGSKFEVTAQLSQNSRTEIVFAKEGTIPIPVKKRFVDDSAWIEEEYRNDGEYILKFGTNRGSWEKIIVKDLFAAGGPSTFFSSSWMWNRALIESIHLGKGTQSKVPAPVDGSPSFSMDDALTVLGIWSTSIQSTLKDRPFASAPVRSKPRRTYDPAGIDSDPEGDSVPMLLASLAWNNDHAWKNLKQRLGQFGSSAGIFDEFDVKRLGKSASDPFQIQVRKFGNKRKGSKQNLIDVGYGISQILPILTELLLPGISRMALLQQPEVHLHPSVQAALGTLFCEIAGQGRQLVVETHSDHLIDRVSMDVRDGKTNLKPEDVSILFFERNDTSVQIHSINLDKLGNVCGAPDSYRSFFMEETTRSLGF